MIPAKWGAMVFGAPAYELADISEVLYDRGYGNIFIHSGNDVNKPTDHLFFLDMALRAVGSEDRRLALAESNNGDEVKEDTIRKPMWACDDTRFTCAPICIQTEGKVTVEVEKSLCTEPVDPCLCNHVGYYVFSTSNFYSNPVIEREATISELEEISKLKRAAF